MSVLNMDTSDFMSLISTNDGFFEYEGEMDIDLCYPDPEQPRYKNLTREGVEDILATLELTKGKLLQPIVVGEKDEKGHKVLLGARRLLASKYYGSDSVPVLIVRGDIDSRLVFQLIENMSRKDLDIREEGRSFKILKDQGMRIVDLAEGFGKSITYISEAMLMSEMEQDKKLSYFNGLYEDKICRDVTTLAAILRVAKKDLEGCKLRVKRAIYNNCLNRQWAKSLSKVVLEKGKEEPVANFEDKEPEGKKALKAKPKSMKETGNGDTSEKLLGQKGWEKLEGEGANKKRSELINIRERNLAGNEKREGFKRRKVETVAVVYEGALGRILLDRVDAEDGFAWIAYDDKERGIARINLANLQLVYIG